MNISKKKETLELLNVIVDAVTQDKCEFLHIMLKSEDRGTFVLRKFSDDLDSTGILMQENINVINELLTKDFIIQDCEDLRKINKDATIVLVDGSIIKRDAFTIEYNRGDEPMFYYRGNKDSDGSYDWSFVPYFFIKGAKVTQKV